LSQEEIVSTDAYSLSTIKQFVGMELGVSEWMTIDQQRVNEFADCTNDHQWIHVDVERAKRESPFGAPIAHGFLTLSLIPSLQHGVRIIPPGVPQVINYGLDRVRFMAPVKVGSRIRNRVVLLSVEEQAPGRILIKTQNTIEIEGEKKPAMVAESLTLIMGGR
jgi:acyl dehydratase